MCFSILRVCYFPYKAKNFLSEIYFKLEEVLQIQPELLSDLQQV